MERVRVAEAQRHEALRHHNEAVEHHRRRADAASKGLARKRWLIAGRAMMAMARHLLDSKPLGGRRSARHVLLAQETTHGLMLRPNSTAPPPRAGNNYVSTARGSPVHLGVALALDSPEWQLRVLRHRPVESDLHRLVAYMVGSSREWLAEFAAMGGVALLVPLLWPPGPEASSTALNRQWPLACLALRTLRVAMDRSRSTTHPTSSYNSQSPHLLSCV